MVESAMSSPAFFASQRATGNCLGNRQHRLKILGEVPSGVEQSRAFNAHAFGTLLQFLELGKGASEVLFITEDSHEILHSLLQIAVDRIRILTRLTLERSHHFTRGVFDLSEVQRYVRYRLRVLGSSLPGSTSENQQVGE